MKVKLLMKSIKLNKSKSNSQSCNPSIFMIATCLASPLLSSRSWSRFERYMDYIAVTIVYLREEENQYNSNSNKTF